MKIIRSKPKEIAKEHTRIVDKKLCIYYRRKLYQTEEVETNKGKLLLVKVGKEKFYVRLT